MKTTILVTNNLLEVPSAVAETAREAGRAALGTVLANFASYGFAPSLDAVKRIKSLSGAELASFWTATERVLKEVTGADRKMEQHVVYSNFPREVLEMSQAEYWLKQILMYIGAPNEWFTEKAVEREPLDEKLHLKVLALAQPESLEGIYGALVRNSARWTGVQSEHAIHLVRALKVKDISLSDFGFKENGLKLIASCLDRQGTVSIPDATDVLRLAAAMSEADITLGKDTSFRKFARGERRFLLSILDNTKNPLADMGLRPTLWKKLLSRLHPGDFDFKNVVVAYHALYQGDYQTFNGKVEALLAAKDASVLTELSSRPGDFARRLHKAYAVFGMAAVRAFADVADKLGTSQLLKLRGYCSTVNDRTTLIYPPKGNWSRAQFVENGKEKLSHQALKVLLKAIDGALASRLKAEFPHGAAVDARAAGIKLQTNDQELATYGRGTVFQIPPEMTFVRTASYWKMATGLNNWFDNGFCFFDENWKSQGTTCWNSTSVRGASFSGDPTNSKDMKGRACQMVDLRLDELQAAGVRYAVWSVLCFSRIAFADAEDVLATLQWGESAQKGKLYEPARAQMVFPLKGAGLTKYVAYIDLQTRELVYMDANLAGKVDSARSNETALETQMPAFVEYLATLPSVADLFANVKPGAVPVLYSDEDTTIRRGSRAYVFRPTNPANSFEQIELGALL